MAPERPMNDHARETLEVDVLFVGGGPAGLAGAIRLKQILRAHNEAAARAGRPPLDLSIALIEKGREIGSHALSGAVLDPRAIAELLPDFLSEAVPSSRRSPRTPSGSSPAAGSSRCARPAALRNHGKLRRVARAPGALAGAARRAGRGRSLPRFAAAEPLLDGERLIGVRTGIAASIATARARRTTSRASTSTPRSPC